MITFLILASLALNGFVFFRTTLPILRIEHGLRQEARLRYDGYAPPWWMGWAYWVGLDKVIFRSKIKPNCLLCGHSERVHSSRDANHGYRWQRACTECDCSSELFLAQQQAGQEIQ